MQNLVSLDISNIKESEEGISKENDFTSIFEIYYKRVYNFIYYRVNCHYTSEDLTSLVFEKIMVNIGTYSKNKSPFEVWVFAISRNVVNDYFRSQNKHRTFSLDLVKEFVSKKQTPDNIVEIAETNDELMGALKVLDEREKSIVALKFGAELKNKEIASILNLTESNVGVILYRSMKKLKTQFEKGDKYE